MTALGLGPFLTFDLLTGAPRAPLREVVARVAAGGGGVVDTSPLHGSAKVSLGAIMSEMPEARNIFVANKIWSTGDYLGDTSQATASLDQSSIRLGQGRSGCQSRASRSSVFARTSMRRMTAVMATFFALPALTSCWYLSRRSRLKRIATSAGM